MHPSRREFVGCNSMSWLTPEIRSEQIRKRIFTHSSGLPRCHKHPFQAPEDDPPVDNEEFRHLGDQVFALGVTDAIQDLYPHLRVGPASKVRDLIKRKDMLAEICMLYGLHMRLNLPERQACDLRASQGVQVDIFKAYVGGVYRDQGAEAASNWLISLLRPYVEVAYRSMREVHLLPPETEIPRQLETPTTHDSSSFSSTSSDGASPALPSYPAGRPRDHRQLPPPQANMPRRSSAQAGDGIGTRCAVTDKPRVRRRRRRSSPRDGGSEDAGKLGHFLRGGDY
ncbi:Ribonuclease III domain containing protein [Russula decolorans]